MSTDRGFGRVSVNRNIDHPNASHLLPDKQAAWPSEFGRIRQESDRATPQ